MIQQHTGERGREHVQTATLRGLLEQGLCRELGRPVHIQRIRRVWYARSSHATARLLVTLRDGHHVSVTAKRLWPGRKPWGNEREVWIYRQLLAGRRFGAPALYASLCDEVGGRYVLFLEDVGDQALRGAGYEDWLQAMRWLAGLHSAFRGRVGDLRALGCLNVQNSAYFRLVALQAQHNLSRAGSARAMARFDRLMRRLPALTERLAAGANTLVHGDLFADNVLIDQAGRVRAVDWEAAAIGVDALDLVTLIDGWEEPERTALIGAYLDETERLTGAPAGHAAFVRTLRHCEAVGALRYLGWDHTFCADSATADGLLDTIERSLDGEGRDD